MYVTPLPFTVGFASDGALRLLSSDENNEEAGEHWTPRDAVKLMARLIFLPLADKIIEGEWRYDEELEKALNDEPVSMPAPHQKLPGRNEPCLCGSGKKFKKCCLSKVEAARRIGPGDKQ